MVRSWSWERCLGWLEVVDSEEEVCLEEDEDCLGGSDFLDQRESAYEVGRGWF